MRGRLFARLLGTFKKIKVSREPQVVVFDFGGDFVVLPSGKTISKSQIIAVDTNRGVVVYKDNDGTIKEESYRPGQAGSQPHLPVIPSKSPTTITTV